LLLALGCGGRSGLDGDLAAGAGRASVAAEGGAPSLSAGGAGNAPSSAAGAPSGGAQNACQSMNDPPIGIPINLAPQNVSGDYQLVTCGQATPCTRAGEPVMTRALSDRVELTVSQNLDDLSHGIVTLHGTGELLLDGRPLDAVFTRRSFRVELKGPINTVCSEEYDLSFSYDFDGYGPRTFNLDFERSPTCNGNNGSEYCKGNVQSTFGDAAMVLE
jgi:hypothetical protein